MSATAARSRPATSATPGLLVAGVRNPRSYGVSRYTARLAEALAQEQIAYSLEERPTRAARTHFHLANSSRAFLVGGSTRSSAVVVTVHDIVPRTRALVPLYRALAYPRLARSAAVIVHSSFAADMLVRAAGKRPARLEVIQHPTQAPRTTDRSEARRLLGWPEDALIAVVPGVIRSVKLVREALTAVFQSCR